MPRQQPTHTRRSLRLSQYDNASAGMYFVTLCVHGRACTLGDLVDDRMVLSAYGEIAAESWQWLAQQYAYVSLDAWIIMPNHLHGVLIIEDEDEKGGSRTATTGLSAGADPSGAGATRSATSRRKPLGGLVGAFKTVSGKRINALRGTPEQPFWQRDYYEHMIRNERELGAIREYVVNNPLQWALDAENPGSLRRH